MDCARYENVANRLDALSRHMISKMQHPTELKPVLRSFREASTISQRYGSFLNLEYYDLQDFLKNLQNEMQDSTSKRLCQEAMDEISRLIVYERHTTGCKSNGVSVYLSNFLIPENIYQSHHQMYKSCSFSRKTGWDEMIDLYRIKIHGIYSEILLEDCRQAHQDRNLVKFKQINSKIKWALQKDLRRRQYSTTARYLDFLSEIDLYRPSRSDLENLEEILMQTLITHPRPAVRIIFQKLRELRASAHF
jgi:hypothetical protein